MPRETTMAKKPTHIFLKVVVLLVLVGVLVVVLFPQAAQGLLTGQLSKALGLPVQIREFVCNFSQPQFRLKELIITNPHGFPAAELAAISEVKVQYVPSFGMLRQLDLQKVEINFRELRLVRNQQGEINLPVQSPLQAAGDNIDEVILNLGSVIYTDLSGKEPVQKTFDLNLGNEIYRNVKGIAGILEIVNWEVLKRTGVDAEKKVGTPPAKEEMPKIASIPVTSESIAPQPPTSQSPESDPQPPAAEPTA